ncbi:hypothetical protein Asi03nite_73350 [Actinoplanes siamensis]|uniref:Uncharacterized protein n=1 Tax=Actinoplanes siamensis TaxID=1223317 RepID=A0A919NFC8_9ACTN|nr:hypothetical protein Asi03nite_73350 [Actinoplanes siamensis]
MPLMWLGADKVFDAFKFYVKQTPYGVMQVHGYRFDAHTSTFIVEMNQKPRQCAGSTFTPAGRSARGVGREVGAAHPGAVPGRPRRRRAVPEHLESTASSGADGPRPVSLWRLVSSSWLGSVCWSRGSGYEPDS